MARKERQRSSSPQLARFSNDSPQLKQASTPLYRTRQPRYTIPHICGHRQVVRHQLPKLTLAGSSPVARSIRISGTVTFRYRAFFNKVPGLEPARVRALNKREDGGYSYSLSILKSNNGDPACCNRYTFSYENCAAGEGHFIHTYQGDGNPLPSFEGEPEKVAIEGDIDTFTNAVWDSLNPENKVSLFVRFIDLKTGKAETRIVNKNQ